MKAVQLLLTIISDPDDANPSFRELFRSADVPDDPPHSLLIEVGGHEDFCECGPMGLNEDDETFYLEPDGAHWPEDEGYEDAYRSTFPHGKPTYHRRLILDGDKVIEHWIMRARLASEKEAAAVAAALVERGWTMRTRPA